MQLIAKSRQINWRAGREKIRALIYFSKEKIL